MRCQEKVNALYKVFLRLLQEIRAKSREFLTLRNTEPWLMFIPASEPEGMDQESDLQYRRMWQVLQRSHHRSVRPWDLGHGAHAWETPCARWQALNCLHDGHPNLSFVSAYVDDAFHVVKAPINVLPQGISVACFLHDYPPTPLIFHFSKTVKIKKIYISVMQKVLPWSKYICDGLWLSSLSAFFFFYLQILQILYSTQSRSE